MCPDIKKITQIMVYLILTEKSKATTKPWCNHLLEHPARKWSGSILGHKTHTNILTFPTPT